MSTFGQMIQFEPLVFFCYTLPRILLVRSQTFQLTMTQISGCGERLWAQGKNEVAGPKNKYIKFHSDFTLLCPNDPSCMYTFFTASNLILMKNEATSTRAAYKQKAKRRITFKRGAKRIVAFTLNSSARGTKQRNWLCYSLKRCLSLPPPSEM